MGLSICMTIVTVLGGLLLLYNAYFLIMGLLGLFRRRTSPPAAPQTRFAVVAAARNEEGVIGHLVDSLRAQNYPAELFDIYVAPNNCTDKTEQVAAQHGAKIFHHKGEVHSKGEVLSQFVDDVVLAQGYDAMLVFDADNLMRENYLQLMNDAICAGEDAVQGFRDSKNPKQTFVSGSYSVTYWVLNIFFYYPRYCMGLSSMINGSGFAVTARLLQRTGGWRTQTLTEDYEYTAQCVLADSKVAFVPQAVLYDEQPLHMKQSFNQRRRWGTGSLQGLKQYGGKLLKKAFGRKSFTAFDMFLTYITPAVQIAGIVNTVAGTVLAAVYAEKMFNAVWAALLAALAGMLGMLIGCSLVALVGILIKRARAGSMWKAILAYGYFMFTWMLVTLSVFIKPARGWAPIAHTNTIDLQEVDTADKETPAVKK